MASSRIGVGLQPVRPIADPLQSISQMMGLATAMQGYEDNQKARGDKEALNAALQASGGDLGAAAKTLRGQGRAVLADEVDQKASARRKAEKDALFEQSDRAAKGFSTATNYLQAVEDAPADKKADLYAKIRPEILRVLPEQFHQSVPVNFDDDPSFVSAAIPFGLSATEAASRRAEAIRKLNEVSEKQGKVLDRDKDVIEALIPWLEHANSAEEVQGIIDSAEQLDGASPAVRARIGDWEGGELTDGQRRELVSRLKTDSVPQTVQSALLRAHEEGNKAKVNGLMSLYRTMQAAEQNAKTAATPEGIKAVLENPTIWNDISPTLRGDMLPHLAKAGFDFGAAAKSLTDTQKAGIERWRTDALADLAKERRATGMSEEEFQAANARVEQSYRVQMGKPESSGSVSPNAQAIADERRNTVLYGKGGRRGGKTAAQPAPAAGNPKADDDAAPIIKALTDRGKAYTLDAATQKPIVTDGKGRRVRIDSIDEDGKIKGTVID